ncbi:MAG: hypothetical protein ACRDOK_28320 [Streptosporangiaceae bacterium]
MLRFRLEMIGRGAGRRGNQEQPVDFRGARLRVVPPGSTTFQLCGGVEEGKGWPRIEAKLVEKARRQRVPGAPVVADIRDGMWQFTPWAPAGSEHSGSGGYAAPASSTRQSACKQRQAASSS